MVCNRPDQRRRTPAPRRRAHRRRRTARRRRRQPRQPLQRRRRPAGPRAVDRRPPRGRENRSRAGYFAYFSDPANAVRTALSFVAEVVREIGQSTRARVRKEPPAGRPRRPLPLHPRLRDRRRARRRGRRRHRRHARRPHRGLRRPRRLRRGGPPLRAGAAATPTRCCARLDRSLALIAQVAEHAPRAYRIVRALRPRPEPRRDLPRPLRPHPRRPGPGRLRAARAAQGAAHAQRRRGPRRGARRAAPARRGGRRAAPPARGARSRSCWPPATSGWSPSPTCRTA